MAGNYPDVPGHRMAWDRDGTISAVRINSGTPIELTSTQNRALNGESLGVAVDIFNPYGAGNFQHILIFPELRSIAGMFGSVSNSSINVTIQHSLDTTNGVDGIWTNGGTLTLTGTDPIIIRNNIETDVTIASAKAIRFSWARSSENFRYYRALHIYGAPVAGENPNRLRLWHPTLDQEVDGAYFDWDDIPRNTSEDKTFRVKNNSASSTASDIDITIEALTDTSPSFPAQHLFQKASSPGFASSVNLTSLAPGGISEEITIRRVTPVNATMSLWWARIIASASSWS